MWTQNRLDVLAFARALHRAGRFDDIDAVLYFFEKPWKWDAEHKVWVDSGSPLVNPDGWELFVKRLEKLS